MRLQLHTTGIEPVTYSLQILRHTMVAAIVQTRLYVFGRSIDFDFDRCRGQFVSTRPMPIPLNFGIAASLLVVGVELVVRANELSTGSDLCKMQ